MISLIKKDFILMKKYVLFLIAFAIGGPILVSTKLNIGGHEGFMAFFLVTVLLEYAFWATVSMLENKCKGSLILCTTPYTRNTLVQSNYLLILVIFICSFAIYSITSLIVPIGMKKLDIFSLSLSFLIIAIYFAIIIPFQYKYGYVKTNYIQYAVIFLTPFIAPNIVQWLNSKNIHINFAITSSKVFSGLFLCLIALLIGYISMLLSTHIYSRKSL